MKRWGKANRVEVEGRQFLLRETGLQAAPACWIYGIYIRRLSRTENYELLNVA